MRLLTFRKENTWAIGIKTENGVLDVGRATALLSITDIPQEIQEVIAGGQAVIDALSSLSEAALSISDLWSDESALVIGPCVTAPSKIICVGLNYRKHAEETNSPIPLYPILFNKFVNTLAGQGEPIPLPKVTKQVDYEAELAIVIGKQCKYTPVSEAFDHVFGYCNVNDLSARDLQMRTQQWLLGKSCDKFSPLGPYLVTADEVGDPNNLEIKSIVNGEVRQHSNTSDMIFRCDEIVSYISQHMTLVPGDIILTGTPEGVVMGYPPEKQVYLREGDVVTIEIEKLGSLTNRMIAEA
ncbi:fumarylacetoacetate hydrolase family protein (plasmid) [Paenibacillus rhizovicinus]|uniref:Fumarylacetoacetate hydrolase family protein n=1 Tax=Paenibacillus rhizovicinus TaxID=2704463 RepID=A0A6C0PAF9_9BACL|nr:fumarylacetoacetate hydrolase family protein [Paenibacillus rhizovicinus]QHW35537.1 fumarylacetoacetate hydrolase family protein [Paenibacillus rhizovicinus]